LADAIVAQTTTPIYNVCGTLALAGSAWVIKGADAVITPDTGMMHIAAAFNKRVISVWGNTIPAFGMYPFLPNHEQSYLSEVKGLSCRPCSKIGYAKCPKGHFNCMEQQDIPTIIAKTIHQDPST
jgi:ADP-heptose:LPS heptosyltransferase